MLGAVAGTAITGHAAESPKVAGQVTAVSGAVTVTRPEVTPQSLKFRDNLYWRDVVDARKDGIARVLLGGKTTVTVRELTRLELREEKRAEGIRYVADLVSGKVRASVARMLMRPGEQVEVWTWNAVASVRGTDFIVEAVERPAQAGAFGLLGEREVAQGMGDSATKSRETVVVTLSGLVDVSNRMAGTGRAERIGAYEAVRVSGRQDPVRLQINANEMRIYLKGLTPPRPQEARSADRAEAVGSTVERVAIATSSQSTGAVQQGGGDRAWRDGRKSGDQGGQSGQNGSSSGGQSASSRRAHGNGNGLALGQLNGGGNLGGKSSKLGLGNPNLAKHIGKGKKK
jgi:hypothetical protein